MAIEGSYSTLAIEVSSTLTIKKLDIKFKYKDRLIYYISDNG